MVVLSDRMVEGNQAITPSSWIESWREGHVCLKLPAGDEGNAGLIENRKKNDLAMLVCYN